MSDDGNYRRVDPSRLEQLVIKLFSAAGVSDEDAQFMGHVLTDADLRGVHTHGTRFAPRYVESLREGSLNTQPNRRLVVDAGAVGLYDGDNGLGHVAAARAMEIAIQKAKDHGMGSVSVRHNGHCGAVAYYAQQAVDAGCLGFAASTGGIAIAPFGGTEQRCGLNPISWAAPTRHGWAFNLDMAPSVVAGSKVDMVRQRGERLPVGWAVDAQGEPTDDPVAARSGGTLLPIGGYKGVGLSIAAEILCGVFSGSRSGAEGTGSGHLLQAIDIEHLMPLAEFTDGMERMIEYVKSSALAPGSSGITLPGELEWQKRQEFTAQGIPLDGPSRRSLREAAEEAGLPYTIEL
ncbi:MAG: hypothetical protein CL878_07710 [Dehalococcoidia bacterium]|nr:hypothetical protein [Dehalococcoidia bacterium]